ncbi:hypothetical protein SM124_07670 [Bacillus sp. 31A1R]|uniref:Uncharacterized protein n=1 Tax=Robertmurraya mangrovi TaxID=3098077 RepID=A0ABU5IWX3_9BACI|nr:hypothetical protein [Bacillus sp. 31A1R]MDZ5471625.1 hypothetical protein [Bacillus sp. 31A1R]
MNIFDFIINIIEEKGPVTLSSLCDEVNSLNYKKVENEFKLQVSQIRSVLTQKNDLFLVVDDLVSIKPSPKLIALTVVLEAFQGPCYKITVNFIKETFYVFEWNDEGKPIPTRNPKTIGSVSQFKKEISRITIQDWEEDYQLEYLVLDGIFWSIKLCTEEKIYEREGLQSFPKEWPQFCLALKKLTGIKIL